MTFELGLEDCVGTKLKLSLHGGLSEEHPQIIQDPLSPWGQHQWGLLPESSTIWYLKSPTCFGPESSSCGMNMFHDRELMTFDS